MKLSPSISVTWIYFTLSLKLDFHRKSFHLALAGAGDGGPRGSIALVARLIIKAQLIFAVALRQIEAQSLWCFAAKHSLKMKAVPKPPAFSRVYDVIRHAEPYFSYSCAWFSEEMKNEGNVLIWRKRVRMDKLTVSSSSLKHTRKTSLHMKMCEKYIYICTKITQSISM